MFWVIERTVSLRRFFEYPQHMFLMSIKKINFWYALLTQGLDGFAKPSDQDQQYFQRG